MIATVSQLTEHIEQWFTVVHEPEFAPEGGWHTITVGAGYEEPDPGSLKTWLRLFEMYSRNRSGKLYWKEVPHFNREKRVVEARFCIQ